VMQIALVLGRRSRDSSIRIARKYCQGN
jgi:hypothetical protein